MPRRIHPTPNPSPSRGGEPVVHASRFALHRSRFRLRRGRTSVEFGCLDAARGTAAERGMASRQAVTKWLLEGDPAIRWQAMRDLTDEPAEAVAAERARVAAEGWGAQLLGLQTPDGHWGDDTRHGWMTTTDALQLLKDLGADPAGGTVRQASAGSGTHHLVSARRPALLRRRDRGLHQRADPGDGRLLRRGGRRAARAPARRAARGRRLELRGAPEQALLVPLDDLRAGRAARNTRRRGGRPPR